MWEKHKKIKDELIALDLFIKDELKVNNNNLNELVNILISSGGKRLRPAFAILSAGFGKYDREKVFPIAAALEVLHTATLVHDDIIDNANMRRGVLTLQEKHNVNIAVYTGDYLLVKSVLLLAKANIDIKELSNVARAIESVCIGEVDQYFGKGEIPTVKTYLKRIFKKTAVLFSASCALGAYAGKCDEKAIKTLAKFGMFYGVAFQIKDDLLDLESNENKHGKPVLKDLKEGYVTLPFILAARENDEIKKAIEDFFIYKKDSTEIIQKTIDSGGVVKAKEIKERYKSKCKKLLFTLPNNYNREVLSDLTEQL